MTSLKSQQRAHLMARKVFQNISFKMCCACVLAKKSDSNIIDQLFGKKDAVIQPTLDV